jgi:mannose-6-phosphate isomerase-like protein (cupin superfamily)
MSDPVAPFAVLSGEGTLLETPTGGSVTIKAHTGNTNGSMTVLEFVLLPKEGPALHTHLREDELWYVLDGDFRFKAGDALFRASKAGMAFGPRGTPHCFQNIGDAPARLLVITTPSGLERFSRSTPSSCPALWIRRCSPPWGTPTGSSLSGRRLRFLTRSRSRASPPRCSRAGGHRCHA